ncbi:helix-turn-helix domain-containing protein [Mucilaginibacter sp. KACC 22773]|uniref:helix-turn-helix domain-containing protein n=1 Tax=Mucilaginibacter sp. KACC 22773 TaxID=3025671 RepID=UPI0023658B9D|nr:helix-turn-helix domain-containing protein [Mucilaginibacter sp. KACC 22773]WDF79535.1 helix-turn-helix domain-containing protein [Mucilaginibacter sp. KACC 22773]
MKKTVKTSYTDLEFRQLVREELQNVLNGVPGLPYVNVDEGYIGIKEAADLLKIVPGTLYNLVSQNKIPFYKNGKRVLFKKSELDAWLLQGNGEQK